MVPAEGLRRLREADAVVYDRLACRSLLRHVRPGAQRIYAGATTRRDPRRQVRINRTLVRLAKKGLRVVRLKGGDPLIFARGAEEAEHLRRNGVRFEILPAPTAACAAAYAGIPLTDRRVSSKVTFLTARRAEGKGPLDISELPRDGTVVVYMGLEALREVAGKLLRAGWPAETPAAVIEWASTGRQRTVEGPLGRIASEAEAAAIRTPAMTVIGRVVRFRKRLAWFERKPLFGERIVVTRPEDRGLTDRLLDLGADVIYLPVTRIEVFPRPRGLRRALRRLQGYAALLFSSRTAVRLFFEHLFEAGRDVRDLQGIRIHAIGSGTADGLREVGVVADDRPRRATTGSLAESVSRRVKPGERVLYPCAEERNPGVAERIRTAGAEIDEIVLYRVRPQRPEGIDQLRGATILTLTSAKTARSFFSILPDEAARRLRSGVKIACIGPVTARAVRDSGFHPAAVARRHDIQGLVRTILALARKGRKR